MKNTGYLILLVALLCPSFTRAQVITTVAGRGTTEYTDGSAAQSVKLGSPWALAADDKGNIYYSEPGLCVVRKIDAEGKVTTVAGNGTAGPVGDGGMATNAQLNNPYGIALDNSGNLYIADAQNNKIRKVDTAGRITSFYGGLSTPFDVAVDDAGNVYVANSGNNQILKISPAKVVTIIASGFSSSLPGGGDCGYSGELWYWVNCRLAGLAVDKKGNVYVADYWENIIRVIYPTGGMAKIAGYPSVGIGGLPVMGQRLTVLT
jgi:streptogramin lyase